MVETLERLKHRLCPRKGLSLKTQTNNDIKGRKTADSLGLAKWNRNRLTILRQQMARQVQDQIASCIYKAPPLPYYSDVSQSLFPPEQIEKIQICLVGQI